MKEERSKERPKTVRVLKRTCQVVFCILLVAGCAAGIFFLPFLLDYHHFAEEKVGESSADTFSINESSTIYGSNGEVMAKLREGADLSYIPYKDIPEHARNAFIAVEDRTFWDNPGIDVKGIIRVALNAVVSGGEELHGASTITQQLARNEFLTHEVSLERKGKEIFLALELTEKYTKEEILEFYINNICFANGIYGMEGAANAYFNKGLDELSLSQTAYLAAIPNRPSHYDPYLYPEHALERRDKILEDMHECGYINRSELVAAKMEEIEIEKPEYAFHDFETTFAVDCAARYFMKEDGFLFRYSFDSVEAYEAYHADYETAYETAKNRLYTGGYHIYTSLDSGVYSSLQAVLDEQLSFNNETDDGTGSYALQGALTVIDNETGNVVAVVGGRSQENNSVYTLNRAFQTYRQPGSAIKPLIVYAPAISKGYTADSILKNISVSKAKEAGVNVQELSGTRMSLRHAVEQSKNGAAWQLFDKITPAYGMSFIEEMQFFNLHPNDYYNSASLGGFTYGVSTVEMASAYATLANHGTYHVPTCILSIKDSDGKEIYRGYDTKEVYTDKTADDMADILKGVLTRGTASGLGWNSVSGTEAFGKTGTTNGSKDGWFCGSTPYYSIAVWVGFDTPRELESLYGSTYPGQIWKECMLELTKDMEPAVFTRNTSDASYQDTPQAAEGYYSYLEGRDDAEVLSDGYTVADYRTDRVIGESVQEVIAKINALDMQEFGSKNELEFLYREGCVLIDSIYSRKYTAEMQGYLDAAYNEKLASG